MVDEVVSIPELQAASSATGSDQAVIRQGTVDKRATLDVLKDFFIVGATLSQAGVVQLNNTTSSSSTSQAATANAVRLAYNTGVSAQNSANTALSQITGKANAYHTHDASQISSGVFNWTRLPVGRLGNHGAVRMTTSLSNTAADGENGYVPHLTLIKSISDQIAALNDTISALELGSAFMPLPMVGAGVSTRVFPIGTTLLCDGGNGNYGRRGQVGGTEDGAQFGIALGATSAAGHEGRFEIYDVSEEGLVSNSRKIIGVWVHRGAVGTPIQTGYTNPSRVSILCQRVA